jgi:spermidine synthase
MRGPRGAALALVGCLAGAGVPAGAGVLHTEKSLYRNIVVDEEGGVRCMKFGRHATSRQTCMSIADRDRLVFDYANDDGRST